MSLSTPVTTLRRLDVEHHLPAQQDYRLIQERGGNRIIARAEGCRIFDTEGKSLLDGMAGLWCVNVGYNREELARVAYEQMRELPYYNEFFGTTTAPAVLLAAKVSELLGGALSHVFFNSSGSEAIDTVIRIVRYYWQLRGEPDRNVFVSRQYAYHGSTIGGVSLGGMDTMRKQGGPWLTGVEHVMAPYAFNEGFGEDPDSFAERAAKAIEERILSVGPKKVAAFIGEPVQGAGGVIIPPRGYWPRVEAICRKYGILLVSDEVICGFGRLGEWFGFQHYGVRPDLVSMAKGLSSGYLPISAVGVSTAIVEVLRSASGPFVHGYTYSGHPTAAAVALRNISIMEREHLVARTAGDTGPYLAQALQRLAAHSRVGETRSLGLIAGIEIVSRKGTNRRCGGSEGKAGVIVRDHCIKNGLMVRAVRDTLVLSPSLIITHEEIDEMVSIIIRSLDDAEPQLAALGEAG